jgi:FG-GAP repeat
VQVAQLSVTGVSGAPSYFGIATSVSDDGSVVVAGACGSDPTTGLCATDLPSQQMPPPTNPPPPTPYHGQAYVFVQPAGGWATTTTPTATLTAPDTALGDGFGSAVAINAAGTIIAVSAPSHECQLVSQNGVDVGECQGEAYVFSVSAPTDWPSVGTPAILTANGGAIGDFFANSLAIDQAGDTIVAHELNPATDEGHVNVYVRPGAAWSSTTETTQLQSSDITPFDNFGDGLGISGDGKTVVVGSFAANLFAGEAYVFGEPSPGGWASVASPIPQSAILLNSDASEDGELGNAAAVDQAGDTVVIGAFGQFQQSGEAYVYLKGGGWTGTLDETTRLAANDAAFSSAFGNNVSISDDGSSIAVGSNAGGAYLFTEPSGGWPTASPTPILDSTSNPVELLPTLTTGTSQFVLFNGIVSGNAVASGATGTVLVAVTSNNSNAGTVFIYGTQSGPTETISETSGSGQVATVSTQFSAPLVATVVNGSGTGVSGVTVTFTAPANGASGTFSGGVNTAVTDESGMATSNVFTANATAGSYTVTATATDVSGTASFSLTNQAGPIATTISITSTTSLYHSFPLPANTALVDGPPVTVNFTVTQASGSVTPTGTLVVKDGFSDTCTTTTLNSGAGTCTIAMITQLGAGSTPPDTTTLTATYTPFANSEFLASPIPASVTENLVEILSPCATAPTPPQGTPQQQESITTVCLGGNLSVVPNVAEVTNGVPHEACGASTSPMTAGAVEYTVTLTCTKNVPSGNGSLPIASPRRGPWLLTAFEFVALLSILMALQPARQKRTRLRLSCAAGLLCVLFLGGMSSCNGPGGAPPGNYTVDFTVTAGQFQLVVPVTVTVPK